MTAKIGGCILVDTMSSRKQWGLARVGKQDNANRKLSDDQKQEIRKRYPALSQRALAREYGVSRRLIVFVLCPDRLAHNKALFAERQKDGRYHIREKHTIAMRKHRNRLVLLGRVQWTRALTGKTSHARMSGY